MSNNDDDGRMKQAISIEPATPQSDQSPEYFPYFNSVPRTQTNQSSVPSVSTVSRPRSRPRRHSFSMPNPTPANALDDDIGELTDSSHHNRGHTDRLGHDGWQVQTAQQQQATQSQPAVRRSSFSQPRRMSFASSRGSSASMDSADNSSSNIPPRQSGGGRVRAERRQSFNAGEGGRNTSITDSSNVGGPGTKIRQPMRSRLSFTSRASQASSNPRNSNSSMRSSASSQTSNASAAKVTLRSISRQSSRFINSMSSAGVGKRGDAIYTSQTEEVMAKLDCGTGYESIVAAAAVVASSVAAGAASSKSHNRYGVGDAVLVYLTIMNHTSRMDAEELARMSTSNPVNRFGYPPGEGGSVDEQRGPYVYVLATVRGVHFGEDAVYYTVTRADTGETQRADSEWMEPLKSERGRQAARAAADHKTEGRKGVSVTDRAERGAKSAIETVREWYRACRRQLKWQITSLMNGSAPYALRMRVTGINFLVMCSLIYMVIDQARLAFIPPDADYGITVISVVVWVVLVVELALEVLIRPKGYSVLTDSEKAYDPTVARFIDTFHLCFELFSLVLFIPNIFCVLNRRMCGETFPLGLLDASRKVVFGPNRLASFWGRLLYMAIRFRIIAVVRHWKQMWINRTYTDGAAHANYVAQNIVSVRQKKKNDDLVSEDVNSDIDKDESSNKPDPSEETVKLQEDRHLNNAAHIGTALMVVNSHRAMILLVSIVGILPLFLCMLPNGGTNPSYEETVSLLQANNLAFSSSSECDELRASVVAWAFSLFHIARASPKQPVSKALVVWGQLLPIRCDWQKGTGGVFTNCNHDNSSANNVHCDIWDQTNENTTVNDVANIIGVRPGAIWTISNTTMGTIDTGSTTNITTPQLFNITVMFNLEPSISAINFQSFLLQTFIVILVLVGLSVLRGDAGRLVLHPLRRMLKIVLRYATNPLAPPPKKTSRRKRKQSDSTLSAFGGSDVDDFNDDNQLGKYETEQLINAITKITDLLRKCWGVAGAGIISSNLARTGGGKTVVFNPTVQGKLVYALFSFVGICDFSQHLRALDRDIMLLINDVARVVHDEVYRWGLHDSGQCNKNLGAAFLMVFRIGEFEDVEEKMNNAGNLIFTHEKKVKRIKGTKSQLLKDRAATKSGKDRDLTSGILQLSSFPGISAFADRAVIGMLKSFASAHRDRSVLNWKTDFRLGAGVGAFSVGMIFGMDAGWAVEGAVGSEYKIDATYLSPHVNMASRMMSACNQYGVTILLSQAVEALLSDEARCKLRHCDTVTVKGSSVKQKIFTYDARFQGVNFFLFERSAAQADVDAENYSPAIWNEDQDLKAMRQHITPLFEAAFDAGRSSYLEGKWNDALRQLKHANDLLIRTVMEEGYIQYDSTELEDAMDAGDQNDEELNRWKAEYGDGVCRSLTAYMEKNGCVAPKTWEGYRPLTSK